MPDNSGTPARLEKLCVDKGMRMTEQRRIIARVLSDAEDHPDVEELYRRATDVDSNISIATVYRTVRLFEEAGILERHDFRDGRARYEEANTDNHDHLIDVQSGQVLEFHMEEMEKFFFADDAKVPEEWVPEGEGTGAGMPSQQGGKGAPEGEGAPAKGAPQRK